MLSKLEFTASENYFLSFMSILNDSFKDKN